VPKNPKMKPLLPLLLLVCSSSFAQKLTIKKQVDKMDDSEHYTASRSLKLVSPTKKWFAIDPILAKDDSNEIVCTGLYITYSGIGACNENDVMDILFTDSKKLKIKAYNQFHCGNTSAFFIDKSMGDCLADISQLVKPIKSIRFTNGKTYDNLTVDLPLKDQGYFIELQSAIKQQY
jgi:hypothetical protein